MKSLLTLCLAYSLLISSVCGQDPAQGLVMVDIQGKLEAIVGYQLKMKGEGDKDFIVIMEPKETTFRYEGTADPKFLTPGLLVRFIGAFDQNGTSQSAITELEIFTPATQKRMSNEMLQSQTPGIYPAKRPNQDEKPATIGNGPQEFRIVGKLMQLQGAKLQIAAGVRPVVVELDPAAKITVSAGDATFCAAEDAVSVQGLAMEGNGAFVKASSVTITGAKPLAPPERPVRGKRTRSTPAKDAPTKPQK